MTEQGSGIKALLRDYRDFAGARLWLALALMILGALAEGIGILMLVPLMALATGTEVPAIVGFVGLGSVPLEQRFLSALGLFVGAMGLRSLLIYARDSMLAKLQAGYEASLRLRAATTLAARGWTFASRIGQAGMQSLLLTDVPRSSLAASQGQQFVVATVILIVQLVLAAFLSARFAAVALAVLAVGLLFSITFVSRGTRSGLALVQRFEKSAGSGFRLHAGLKAALAQGTVPQFLREYGLTLDAARSEYVRFLRDLSLSRSLAFFGSAVAAALLFFTGYRILELPFPILVTALILFARMAGPAQQLQQTAQNIAAYAPSFTAIEHRLGKLRFSAGEGGPSASLDWSELEIREVTYQHLPGLGVADLTANLKRGEWLGIGGGSGAGKTTLVDLIAGLLVPQAGSIEIDGSPLDDAMLDRWRPALAYVGQEGSIFDDSVRGNLISDSREAPDDQLWMTLETVGLADRIRSLAAGLDERVGDRGSALSGGERQRLAIARALLRNPSLIILDEATSALDVNSEELLLTKLRALNPKPAAVIVAHRPSTLAYCDSVIMIQHRNQVETAG